MSVARPAVALALPLVLLAGCNRTSQQPASASHPGQATSLRTAVARINPASASDGGSIYIKNCSSCHQADGRGVPGAFPPLAGNPLVTGNPLRTIAIVKFGVSGKIVVDGVKYNATMPAWGQLLTDEDIASVVSYIRAAWHNDAKPVSLADVAAASR